MREGVVNILKPTGMTSQDAVTRLKGILGVKKVGHLGTLDPLASGVLPIAVGKATRLFDIFLKKGKSYRAIFSFALSTETFDSDGKVVNRSKRMVSLEEVKEAAKKLVGKISQVPPIYSAKVVEGKRAYEIARSGDDVELKPCLVEIFSLDFVRREEDMFVFDIKCSAGTYIRAIARDMAEIMGVEGYMAALIRTGSGDFEIENALTFEEVESLGENAIIPIKDVVSFLPKSNFSKEDYKKLIDGIKFEKDLEAGLHQIIVDGSFKGLLSSNDKVQRLYLWFE